MQKKKLFRNLASAIGAAMLFAPAALFAQVGTDADTKAVVSYVLMDAGLAKYSQATKKLSALAKQMSNCDDEGADAQSIDATVARLDATPGVKAAIQSTGMATREYVLFSWSLLQNGLAAWAMDQPGGKLPAGASMASVNFYRKHEAEIQSLSKLAPTSNCNEEAEDEDSEES